MKVYRNLPGMLARNDISFNSTPISAVSSNMYIAGSYFVLICRRQSHQRELLRNMFAEDFSRLQPALQPTQYTSVLFFSESIMSDESDLNCFKGHILNEEIDRAKVIYLRKQEEFSHLISQQPKPRYSVLPWDKLETSLIPEDATGAEGSWGIITVVTPLILQV